MTTTATVPVETAAATRTHSQRCEGCLETRHVSRKNIGVWITGSDSNEYSSESSFTADTEFAGDVGDVGDLSDAAFDLGSVSPVTALDLESVGPEHDQFPDVRARARVEANVTR